ncbi:uncharacterized protein Z518_03768 [Rhinocladiella mackenziei CBS 650.93]|uniref:Uncharacterized protein n=1 Tax=Rhinocladiella mackenziei CBS 650.93 TaxID=1442369 RepID=A0A0D2IRL9_9EURO|nr:uncharacterized protein Z518_03768 [Rhinocladiella mackenziei CBS 650.93]KIX05796.1 hypothetical protein Z518_03768 [Rhinocladiella mackenziei CBS 650.93]
MRNALHELAESGNPMDVLFGYCYLMRDRDVGDKAFEKTGENHRDSIMITILENPAIQPAVEYEVEKSTKGKGFVDLRITTKNCYTLIEFKNIQIPYLELDGEDNLDKTQRLEAMRLDQILGLKFKGDKWRTGITIRDWIDGKCKAPISGSVRKQLQSYIAGETVQKEIVGKKSRAFATVIVGSRRILVREMDRHGKWVGKFQLTGWKGSPSVIN